MRALRALDPSAYGSDSVRMLWETLCRRGQYLSFLFGPHSACSSMHALHCKVLCSFEITTEETMPLKNF